MITPWGEGTTVDTSLPSAPPPIEKILQSFLWPRGTQESQGLEATLGAGGGSGGGPARPARSADLSSGRERRGCPPRVPPLTPRRAGQLDTALHSGNLQRGDNQRRRSMTRTRTRGRTRGGYPSRSASSVEQNQRQVVVPPAPGLDQRIASARPPAPGLDLRIATARRLAADATCRPGPVLRGAAPEHPALTRRPAGSARITPPFPAAPRLGGGQVPQAKFSPDPDI